jgi:hypothetical protein
MVVLHIPQMMKGPKKFRKENRVRVDKRYYGLGGKHIYTLGLSDTIQNEAGYLFDK